MAPVDTLCLCMKRLADEFLTRPLVRVYAMIRMGAPDGSIAIYQLMSGCFVFCTETLPTLKSCSSKAVKPLSPPVTATLFLPMVLTVVPREYSRSWLHSCPLVVALRTTILPQLWWPPNITSRDMSMLWSSGPGLTPHDFIETIWTHSNHIASPRHTQNYTKSDMAPNITLYFLNASRSIRIAFLLEALDLPYTLVCAERAPNGLAPPDFKARIRAAGQPLGKSPTLVDGAIVISESGAIVEYLLDTYDTNHDLIPSPENAAARAKVHEWLYAAEGTFMVPAMPVLYTR